MNVQICEEPRTCLNSCLAVAADLLESFAAGVGVDVDVVVVVEEELDADARTATSPESNSVNCMVNTTNFGHLNKHLKPSLSRVRTNVSIIVSLSV